MFVANVYKIPGTIIGAPEALLTASGIMAFFITGSTIRNGLKNEIFVSF